MMNALMLIRTGKYVFPLAAVGAGIIAYVFGFQMYLGIVAGVATSATALCWLLD